MRCCHQRTYTSLYSRFHVAGAAAVEALARDDAPERRRGVVPAVAERHGVHVAGVDERGLLACAGQANHEVATAGQSLQLADPDGIGEPLRQPRDTLFHQRLYVLLDFSLVDTGVGALDAHELSGEPPRVLLVDLLGHVRSPPDWVPPRFYALAGLRAPGCRRPAPTPRHAQGRGGRPMADAACFNPNSY